MAECDKTELSPLIDIDRVFQSKNPHIYRFLPRFVLNYLKRIVHQDQINDFILRYHDKIGLDFIQSGLNEYGIMVSATGLENIPTNGRFIVAANHPLGGLDAMALMHVFGKVRPDIVIPGNDLVLNVPNIRPLFIPVNKHGSNTHNLEAFDKAFAGDSAILYFPAGLCSRKVNGKIEDLEWKKTFITRARRFQRDVIPVYIEGRNSNFFYNLANWRVRLGIKWNIEMFFLVDEMFKQKEKNVVIKIGQPVPYQTFDKSRKDADWAQEIRRLVYGLKNK